MQVVTDNHKFRVEFSELEIWVEMLGRIQLYWTSKGKTQNHKILSYEE